MPGGARRHKVSGRALEDDPATVVAGARTEVDDPVGVRYHRLMVLYDDDRLARVRESPARSTAAANPVGDWR